MSVVNVQAIHALDDLRAALVRFASEAQSTLDAAQQEIQRTLDWLTERANYWRNEVTRREALVRQAEAALARCQASAYYDSRTGRSYVPDCSAYQTALLQARVRLREAEAELQNVQQWTRHIQQAIAEYQREAQRLTVFLSNDLPKATTLLTNSANILRSYVATSPPSASIGIPSPLTASTAHGITQQAWFRNAMAEMSAQERGEWGERAVLQEARNHGHQILVEHHDKTTTPGYDCVSWDGKSLHIWEAKNWSGTVTDLSAITPERMRANVEQLLDHIANHPERASIVDAIQNDRVQWHIRVGPDADVSFKPLESLGWDNVEVRQYSYDEMLKLYVPPRLDTNNVPTPIEFREGNVGGAERRG
ncbi:MAG: hypothetical protein N2559_15520 [Anaerolineae bacterium]|nr:hypothetical protein [Anaerolineae bacterium]